MPKPSFVRLQHGVDSPVLSAEILDETYGEPRRKRSINHTNQIDIVKEIVKTKEIWGHGSHRDESLRLAGNFPSKGVLCHPATTNL